MQLFVCFDLLSHHDLGDQIQNLLVASAAPGGAVCHLLNILESLQNRIKILVSIQGIGNIRKAYLLAVAHHIILLHDSFLRL